MLNAAAIAAFAAVVVHAAPEVETGDIVLIHSQTPQAVAIERATRSPFTHTGVVVMEGGKPYVYEAVAHVRKTPLANFMARAKAGTFAVRRYPGLDDAQRAQLAAAARAKVGTRYDLAFASNNDALYCSEYVRAVYAAAGLDVGNVEHVRDLAVDDPVVHMLIAARWKKHPACKGSKSLDECLPKLLDAEVITPGSLAADARLVDPSR